MTNSNKTQSHQPTERYSQRYLTGLYKKTNIDLVTFLMLPPDFFTISSSTIDCRQILIMMAWGKKTKSPLVQRSDLSNHFQHFIFHLFRHYSITFQHILRLTCGLVMVTHCRRSLLIKYSKASSSFTSHLLELLGFAVPFATGTCCRVKPGHHKYDHHNYCYLCRGNYSGHF